LNWAIYILSLNGHFVKRFAKDFLRLSRHRQIRHRRSLPVRLGELR
jgi:hypothetical protein